MLSYAMSQYYKHAIRSEFSGMDGRFGKEVECSESITHCSCARHAGHFVRCPHCHKAIALSNKKQP
jgi:hypothetical protein